MRKTGAFKSIPEAFPAQTHYKRALKALKTVKPDGSIKNIRNQNRKLTAQSMDTLMKALTSPITEVLNIYTKAFKSLHPFEATVADLTVNARVKAGSPDLDTILSNLKTLRTATSRTAKEYASRGSNAESAVEAKQILEEGMSALEQLYEQSTLGKSFEDLVELQKDLRRIPVVELDTPTVVLVGAPNVGEYRLPAPCCFFPFILLTSQQQQQHTVLNHMPY
jgi:nucleolar GTP-binding protein